METHDLPLGVYTALMVGVPALKVAISNVEVAAPPSPLNALPGPRTVKPSKNLTESVGVTPEGDVTVAMKVTEWP